MRRILYAFALVCSFAVSCFSQVTPFLNPRDQFIDANGNPLAGGKVFSYSAGTSTPQATYVDNTGTIQNTNPIFLDAAGAATIWLGPNPYRICVQSAASVQQWCIDNVPGSGSPASVVSLTVTTGPTTINGNFTIVQGTPATSSSNVNSANDCLNASFWNGASSAIDQWCWNDILGTGANPTSTFTLSHSGSPGTAAVSLPYSVSVQQLNKFVMADQYNSLQAAITAACSAGGTVLIPPGTYAANTALTLCSNLSIIGAGRGQANGSGCATTITSTMTTGDLFKFNAFNDSHLSDFCIKYTGTGANAAVRFTAAQRNIVERLYISGSFGNPIEFDSSAGASASTIWNVVRDTHTTLTAAGGTGCLFDSKDATNKVINSNTLWNVACTGGTGGVGLKVTNTAGLQIINENVINCNECTATTGTAVQIDSLSTRGMVFIDLNAEGSTNGFVKATGNTVTFIGGNISSNSVNVTDSQPGFTQFIGTNVGGIVQQFSITPIGDINADGLCFGNAACAAATINGPAGTVIEAAANGAITLNASDVTFGQKIVSNTSAIFNSSVLNNGTGLKHMSICASGCDVTQTPCNATGGSNTVCTMSATTWPGSAFVDATYKVSVTGIQPTGTSGQCAEPYVSSRTSSTITIAYAVLGSGSCQWTEIDVIGMHN